MARQSHCGRSLALRIRSGKLDDDLIWPDLRPDDMFVNTDWLLWALFAHQMILVALDSVFAIWLMTSDRYRVSNALWRRARFDLQ
jgi:hypothetical protein